MPLVALACLDGHKAEMFCHVAEDCGSETRLCACGSTLAPVLSTGRGLTWFEEGRPRTLWNLGHEPVTVRSHEEHKRLMRERGLEWRTRGRGYRGSWI